MKLTSTIETNGLATNTDTDHIKLVNLLLKGTTNYNRSLTTLLLK